MFVRYENNRLSSQPHAVAGVSGLDSMIGISSHERNVHVNEKNQKQKTKKKKENRVRPLRQGFCDQPATALQ